MQSENATLTDVLTFKAVKELGQQTGPCLTLLLPVSTHGNDRRQDAAHMRAALRQAEEEVAKLELGESEADAFLAPVRQILEEEQEDTTSHGLAIFRGVEMTRRYRLPQPAETAVALANHFYVRPLLPQLMEDQEFYILALSQKNVRLIHCTRSTSEEVALPEGTDNNLSEFNQLDQPDHRLENRASGGQAGKSGGHPGLAVAFGTGSDNDQKDHYLWNFYVAIDRAVQEKLKEHPLPVVLAGVDYELALYRKLSGYSNLVADGAHGAPDGLKGGELHKRALEALGTHKQARLDKALAQYEKAGGDRILTSVREVIKAAYDGRVLHLFLAEGAQHFGNFDEMTRRVHEHQKARFGDEDLLNAAALQTLMHNGDVFVVPKEQVPGQSDAAASLRF